MRRLNSVSKFAFVFATLLGFSVPLSAQQIQPTVSTSSGVSGGLLTTETRLDQSSRFAQHPSRVIVRFKVGAPSFLPGSGRAIALSRARNTHLVINPPGLSVRDTLARYRQNPNVIYAEPDYIVQAIGTVGPDPMLSQQWDMTKISAPTVWASTPAPNASTTVVAIVDTGLDFLHPDLADNIYSDAITPTVHGFTCIGGSCVPGGADDHGHGTHVAGTIGAVGNNATGIAGMNWSTKILPIKFLNSGGSGAISDAILGFQQILDLKKRSTLPVNIRVTNNSWGGGGFSQALQDAMLAVENEGILNVCAAGNSGVNADTTPMYPAAYNNRGIVSVLASDASDLGAYFTNYGVSSVDIAAPGVSILSTAAAGSCSLCDPSGYRVLSGTSMASPHVAGAALAMMAAYPNLTPAQARDALLDPMNYDTLTDEKARRTSSGGRLNFAKVLANAGAFQNLTLNQLNRFPTVTVGPDAYVASGGPVSFTQSASDPDQDTLRSMIGRAPVSTWSAWIFEWRANQIFPATAPFTAPPVSTLAVVPYDSSVSDNRGGGASGRNWAVVTPTSSTPAPTVSISIPQSTYTVGDAVPVSVAVTGQAGTSWDINAATKGSSSGTCCYSGNLVSLKFNTAGVYRITSQAVDPQLNTSAMDGSTTALAASKVVVINPVGGTTPLANPPLAAIKLDKRSGTAPLTVNVDASGSSGAIATYYFDCGVGYASGQATNTASCNFTQAGTYWVRVLVTDNSNIMGIASDYVVVSPAQPGSDTTPPSVGITSPIQGATLVTPTTVQVTASDAGGIKQVGCYVDTLSTPCGAMTGSGPYNFQFDPATLSSYGPHTIVATAKDNAGNTSSTSLSITTAAVTVPTVTLTPSSTTLQRNKSKTFSATLSNSPTYGFSGVVFTLQKVGASVVTYPKDVTSPYTFNFSSSTAGTFILTAIPHDNAPGTTKAGTPASVTITVK